MSFFKKSVDFGAEQKPIKNLDELIKLDKLVKLFLNSGIEAELIDNDGKTALMLANEKSSPNAEITRLLSDSRRN